MRTQTDTHRRVSGQRGLILVETLVAIAILSTAVLAGLVAVSTASITTDDVSNRTTASWVLTSQVEAIRAADFVNTPGVYATVTPPAGYTVQTATSAFPDGDINIQNVTVTVSLNGQQVMQSTIVKVRR